MELSPARIASTEQSLKTFSATIRTIIQSVENIVSEHGVEEFINKNMRIFMGMFQAYECVWSESGSEVEHLELLKTISTSVAGKNNTTFQDALEDFFQSELEYDRLLERLDQMRNSPPPVGGNLLELRVQTLEYPEMVPSEKLAAMGCQVVIFSFGEREGALRWKEETNCPFLIYLDIERKLYNLLGMFTGSLAKCWSRRTSSFYVGALLAGRKLLTPYTDLKDDPMQMGGDILVQENGKIVKKYLNQFSSDRPSLQSFMDEIKK